MNLRKHLLMFLLLSAFAPIGTFSEPAYAQRAASPPEIDRFTVDSDNRLRTGAELTFKVEGTPRGKASVRISGINRNVPLKEVSSGVYEGGYTIKKTDRITASNTARATLRAGNRTTGETYTFRSGYGSARNAAAPPAVPKIDRFTVTPINSIEPGADLRFAMTGTPGAKAYFTIEGVATNVPMQEVRSGQYEGSYTVRRLDHFPSAVSVLGTLEANGQATGARLNRGLLADERPPVIGNVFPRDGETVAAGKQTSISATFDDGGGVGIDLKSVRVVVSGRDITQSSQITLKCFNYYSANLQPGRYPVEVTASDLAGNEVRRAWTFFVAAQGAGATLPLQVLSPANNAQVSGGVTEVRGRTAPDARVDVRVQGVSSLAGLFGATQQIHDQTLRSDANGNFGFSFRPQYAVAGTRYEITLNASKADLNTETKLVLFQQQ